QTTRKSNPGCNTARIYRFLQKQVEETSGERDKLKQRIGEMVKHKEQLLQEIDKLSRQSGEVEGLSINQSDYAVMKERYESKILRLKQAMLDYKTRGDRKISGVVQDLNMVSRRCDQLELCVAEVLILISSICNYVIVNP
ncbi:hypothetical protein BVRB_039550, partial [Beta vulgaris subsp. vulgaris]